MTEVVQSIINFLIAKVEDRCGTLGPLIKLAYTCEDRLGIEIDASQMPCYPLFQYYKRLKAGLPVCKLDVITGYYAFKIFEVVDPLDTPDKLQQFYKMVGIIEVYGYTDNDEWAAQYTDLLLELYKKRTPVYPLYIPKCITKNPKPNDRIFQILQGDASSLAIAYGCASRVVNGMNDENIAIEWYQQTGNPIFLLSYIINLQDILNCK
jgi:hypothetical protein